MNKNLQKIIKYLKDKNYRVTVNSVLGLYNNMSDEQFLKKRFKASLGYELNLENPKTFNEKLQWLKLNDRKDIYTTMVDKYKVREYIKEKIGEEYLIPLIGVWDNPDDIDFDKLPEKFVLKCNHNSSIGMCICKDKSKINIKKIKRELKKGLKQDFYLRGREWPYKNVERKIICEEYMEDNKTKDLKDYKFFCFNGKVECMFIASDRQNKNEETKFDFFDKEFNHLNFTNGHPSSNRKIQKPNMYDEMIKIAEKLSKDIPQVRVDLYEINDKIYFGELTFFHWSGLIPFKPKEWDYKLGELIKIKSK